MIRLMKAASTDGPSGLLAACPIIIIIIIKIIYIAQSR